MHLKKRGGGGALVRWGHTCESVVVRYPPVVSTASAALTSTVVAESLPEVDGGRVGQGGGAVDRLFSVCSGLGRSVVLCACGSVCGGWVECSMLCEWVLLRGF